MSLRTTFEEGFTNWLRGGCKSLWKGGCMFPRPRHVLAAFHASERGVLTNAHLTPKSIFSHLKVKPQSL